ncbi:MAG: tripartite tricarboxylate transporter substrate binding protein [Reyranella sp.]|uniref:Bug family tripartite tricarboxylate transporter substrate binding protein n=1 Tax=Reyranella sp. TaxID=1929291 RepID=UPI001AC2D63C|nr:tripartite tricarboxylate transporter substrate binding protein [Reyranella sp.]MBN9087070.1 tripartite tricarboxylate transporter substrate binding protein [Reyranella sp.]
MRLLIAALTAALASTTIARAQTWPEKPVHVIVAFTPGSATDVIARSLSNELSAKLGQPVIVENKPGAGGTIAAGLVAKAAPDGYTLLVNSSGHTVSPWIYANLSYDTAKDLRGVSLLARQPNIMVASPDKGWKTVNDLVKQAKEQPGKISFASAGVGSATHINGEKFKVAAGIDVLHVPYKGTPEALNDVMGGRVEYFFSPVVSALSLIRDKRVVALANGSPKRSSVLPDLPTTEEAGYKNSGYDYWAGLLAPNGTPPAVIDKLNKAVIEALALPEVKERLAKIGGDPSPTTPKEFDELVVRELGEYRDLVKAAGIKAQ